MSSPRHASRALLVLVSSLVACTSGATSPKPRPTPTKDLPAPPVKAEPPRAFGQGNRVGAQDLDAFYRSWFDRPYDEMFLQIGPRLPVLGATYGVYRAGVSGILLYGGLAKAVADIKGYKHNGFYDISPLSKLAGLPIYRQKAKDRGSFSRYDPRIVRWGARYLVPDPDRRLGKLTYGQIYRAVFSRCFRLFAMARAELQRRGLAQEARAYRQAMGRPKFEATAYLVARYPGALKAYALPHHYTNLSPQGAMGFWLRRHLGGSESALWTALEGLLARYDSAWLKRSLKK